MLIYFCKGVLPWMNVKASNIKEKYVKIYKIKKSTSNEELCKDLPIEFTKYMNYVTNLTFSESPDYIMLYNLFFELFNKEKYKFDNMFEWINL